MRVLVAGATGYLGSHVARELHRRGHRVRALVRRAEQHAAVRDFADEIVLAQVTSASSLRRVADGAEAVFSSVGITRQRDQVTYEDVDYQGNLNLLTEALTSRISRFVYVSVFRGRELRHVRLIAAKERFVDRLQSSGVESYVVRPTGFFSDMAAILRMAQRGLVVLLNDGRSRINPVSGHDVAMACVDALVEGRGNLEIGGPEVYSYNEIAALAARVLRTRSRVWHMPASLVGLVGSALDRFAPSSVSGALQFVSATSAVDMVAPAIGSDRLGAFFESIAEASHDA